MKKELMELERLRNYAKAAHEELQASDLDGYEAGKWYGEYVAYTRAYYLLKPHVKDYTFTPPPQEPMEEFWRG